MSSLADALAALEAAARRVRESLSNTERSEDRAAQQMLSVLLAVQRRGGRVTRSEFLTIGERYGYRRRGMAGFYQQLVRSEGDDVAMTDAGRGRMAELGAKYESLIRIDLEPEYSEDDPFIRWVRASRPGSGSPYSAEQAKRDLYRT